MPRGTIHVAPRSMPIAVGCLFFWKNIEIRDEGPTHGRRPYELWQLRRNKALLEIQIKQHKITPYTAHLLRKNLIQIFRIIDHFAYVPSFARQSKMFHALCVRGRYHMINATTASQRFNAIHPNIRVNATE